MNEIDLKTCISQTDLNSKRLADDLNYNEKQAIDSIQSTVQHISELPKYLDFGEIFFNVQILFFITFFILFFNAHRIVRSSTIFYLSGSTIGLFSSLIVFAFVLQKFLPRRALAFPLYLGGWPLSAYIYYKAWQNFGLFIYNYQWYLVIYIFLVLIISFAVCYRFGPPSDIRTINLMKWALQFLSLVGIYFSCTVQPLTITLIFFMVTWTFWISAYDFFKTVSLKGVNWTRMKLFGPTPRRLLTKAEFSVEAEEFTNRELEKMREFCRSSPSAKSWKTISKLSNPHRMASFITGEDDHITGIEAKTHTLALWPDEDDDNEILDDSLDESSPAYLENEPFFDKQHSSDFVTDDDDD